MGTHPIFESDFDCLTEMGKDECLDELFERKPRKERKSSTYLCWSSVAILWITAAYFYFSDCFASEEHNNSWDLLGITLNWPETSCRQMNRTHHRCHESSSLHGWTIHGLWPNRFDGSWPQYCSKDKFHPDEIKDLIPEMEEIWPNLMQDRPFYDFWTHEYEKHGTCAASLPALSNEHLYFEKTLNLHDEMDVENVLKTVQDMIPNNDKTYTLADFEVGFADVTGLSNHQCEIKCVQGDLSTESDGWTTNKIQFIIEVMCCLDKEFNFIPCPTGNSNVRRGYPNVPVTPCRPDIPIAYPKISHL